MEKVLRNTKRHAKKRIENFFYRSPGDFFKEYSHFKWYLWKWRAFWRNLRRTIYNNPWWNFWIIVRGISEETLKKFLLELPEKFKLEILDQTTVDFRKQLHKKFVKEPLKGILNQFFKKVSEWILDSFLKKSLEKFQNESL